VETSVQYYLPVELSKVYSFDSAFDSADGRAHNSDVASLDAEGSGSLVSGETGAVGSVERGSVVGQ
jgi:hypothetical protein